MTEAAKLARRGVQPGFLQAYTNEQYDEIADVVIAERFGWTLDYVRDLGVEDRGIVEAVIGGFNAVDEEKTNSGSKGLR